LLFPANQDLGYR